MFQSFVLGIARDLSKNQICVFHPIKYENGLFLFFPTLYFIF